MNEIGICQLCKRSDVPIREASNEAVDGISFLEIMESHSSQETKLQDVKICFKCQENAIIAYEFKTMCNQLQSKTEELDDFITFEDEEVDQSIGFGDLQDEVILIGSDQEQLCLTDIHCDSGTEYSSLNDLGSQVEVSQEEFLIEEEVIDMIEVDGQYRCHICGSFYKNKDNLSRHLVRHKPQRNFQCSYCPRKFYFNRELNFHLKQHLEPMPEFKCEICTKNYSSKSALKKHMLLHTGSKKFKCNQCSMSFARKFTLQNHLRTHSDVKPFKCTADHCDASFIQKIILQRHLKNMHNQKFYKCEYCSEKSFDKRVDLRIHLTECDAFLTTRQ